MRKQRTTYFISGLLLQASVFAVIIYFLTLVSSYDLNTAIGTFAERLPDVMQDTTVVKIIVAAVVALSMMCYGAARKYSLSRSFRNLTLGLILLDAIVLLWIILSLM